MCPNLDNTMQHPHTETGASQREVHAQRAGETGKKVRAPHIREEADGALGHRKHRALSRHAEGAVHCGVAIVGQPRVSCS